MITPPATSRTTPGVHRLGSDTASVSGGASTSELPQTQRRQRPAVSTATSDALQRRSSSSSSLAQRQGADALVRRQRSSSTASVAIDLNTEAGQAPSSTIEQARAHITQRLSALEFSNDLSDASMQEQRSLEQEYTNHTANALSMRMQAYTAAEHELGANMRTQPGDAVLPVLLTSTQGFITSAARSPIRNTTILNLDPNKAELSSQADRTWIAAAPSGLTAYGASEVLTNAMSRRAQAGNVPAVHAVNIDALLPAPSSVVLKVEGNRKSYVKLDPAGAQYTKLKTEHAIKKRNLLQWQNALEGKGAVAPWIQPVLTGSANLARRALSQKTDLFTSGRLFAASALASGTAGAATKALLGGLQVAPRLGQTKVDDFVGGTQVVNLFEVRTPNPDVPPARITDLPRGLLQTGAEAAALIKHSFNPQRGAHELLLQGQDVARYVLSNMTASFGSAFMGLGAGDIIRNTLVRDKNEPFNSDANLLQQFVQSGSNELLWKAMLDHKKEGAYSIGTSLDAQRDITEADSHDTATEAFKQVKFIRQTITPERQARLPQDWQNALPLLDEMLNTDSPDLEAVTHTLDAIEAAEQSSSGSPSMAFTRGNILAHFESMKNALTSREQLQQYRQPLAPPAHPHAE
jgi:hypothetical protein